jgi:hypothetical protein
VRWALVLALLLPAGAGLGAWWHRGTQRAQCCLKLSNYNNCIASCGIDEHCNEDWKSTEATEKMVLKHFDMQVPHCPAGGKVTLVYGRLPYPTLPCAVCSLEGSHGHVTRP